MLKTIEIENFKSIDRCRFNLGRTNVLIGENGAGKSNILEAVALASAASAGKLDNEFLASRGIRVTSPRFMRSAFDRKSVSKPITVRVWDQDDREIRYNIENDNNIYPSWRSSMGLSEFPLGSSDIPPFVNSLVESLENPSRARKALENFQGVLDELNPKKKDEASSSNSVFTSILQASENDEDIAQVALLVTKLIASKLEHHKTLNDFVIFSPENSALRTLRREGQIEPLGINGEGLSKLLKVISKQDDTTSFNLVKQGLGVFSWFQDFENSKKPGSNDERILLKDRYISSALKNFDQRSVNEGFLYVAFYLALFSSKLTPRFFAADNIDASLNPKMCESLMKTLSEIASKIDKQVILTTHNPAILDGLDLTNEENKLLIVSRNNQGRTQIREFRKNVISADQTKPTRLSEAFIRGSLGGLPRNF